MNKIFVTDPEISGGGQHLISRSKQSKRLTDGDIVGSRELNLRP